MAFDASASQPGLGKLAKAFLAWVSFFFRRRELACGLRWTRGWGPRMATSCPCWSWEA